MSERPTRSETGRTPRTERNPAPANGLGHYEMQYDVSLGYGSDRSITVR